VSRHVNIHTHNLSIPGNRNVRHLLHRNKCVNTTNCTVIYQEACLVWSQETRVETQTNTRHLSEAHKKKLWRGRYIVCWHKTMILCKWQNFLVKVLFWILTWKTDLQVLFLLQGQLWSQPKGNSFSLDLMGCKCKKPILKYSTSV